MDPQLQQRIMIYAGLIPGGVTLVLMLAAWYLHALRASRIEHDEGDTPRPAGDGPRWLLPVLLALGFAGADYAASYTFHLWPDSNNYRFTHAVVLIALVGIAEGVVRLPLLVAMLLRLFVYAGAFWMLAEGYSENIFGGSPTFVGYALVAAVGAALIATAIDRNSEFSGLSKGQGWVDAATWILVAAAMMPLFYMNNFGVIGGSIPAGIIAVLLSTLIVALIFRELRISRGGITVLVGVLLAMLTGSIVQTGAVYLPSLLLLAVAPLVAAVPLKTPSGIRRLVARLVMLLVVLGAAGGSLQWYTGVEETSPEGEVDPYADYDADE